MLRMIKITALIVTLGLVFTPVSAQELTKVQSKIDAHGTAYVSGGVGDKELEEVNQVTQNYNLKLVLAEKSGAYAANVAISISDSKGKRVLEVPSAGPILLTKLALGKYRVRAVYDGQALEKEVTVHAGSLKTVPFSW